MMAWRVNGFRFLRQQFNRLNLAPSELVGLEVFDETRSSPRVRIVPLIPIHAGVKSVITRDIDLCLGHVTHNVFFPAILGWVAHDPPSATLCFPSKKSANNRFSCHPTQVAWRHDSRRNKGNPPVYAG